MKCEMRFSSWTAFAYLSSSCKNMSEAIGGLERKLRIVGVEPPAANIRPYLNHVVCIPGFNCRVQLDRMMTALAELERTAADTIALGRRVIDEARRNGVREFDVRLSGPVGPAPDRPAAAKAPGGAKPKPKRRVPKRPSARKRPR